MTAGRFSSRLLILVGVLGGGGDGSCGPYARDMLRRLRGSNSSSEMLSRWAGELGGGETFG
jgi:hypothetical protein